MKVTGATEVELAGIQASAFMKPELIDALKKKFSKVTVPHFCLELVTGEEEDQKTILLTFGHRSRKDSEKSMAYLSSNSTEKFDEILDILKDVEE